MDFQNLIENKACREGKKTVDFHKVGGVVEDEFGF